MLCLDCVLWYEWTLLTGFFCLVVILGALCQAPEERKWWWKHQWKAAPGDGVMLGGAGVVQRRQGKVAGSATCVLPLSLTPMVRRLYHEDVAKILGHWQVKDDYEEHDKTQITWGGWNASSLSDASANWWILFISRVVWHSQSESGMDGIRRWPRNSFIFFLSGAELLWSSLSVNFYSRKSLHPTGGRASLVLQAIVSTTKGFCVSKEPDLIHQVGEGLL